MARLGRPYEANRRRDERTLKRIAYLKTLDPPVRVGRVIQADDRWRSTELGLEGSPLALFECLKHWESEGLPFTTLPSWAIEELGRLNAAFYQSWLDHQLGERARPPSFTRIAGLTGSQKSLNALKGANRVANGNITYVGPFEANWSTASTAPSWRAPSIPGWVVAP